MTEVSDKAASPMDAASVDSPQEARLPASEPATLFAIPTDSVAQTSDDCYTPRWVFDAMGLRFDLDVAAPIGGPWHVPCDRYYTAADDGLAQPWDGLVWCNPPYSNFTPWADRFIQHDRAVLMGLMLNRVKWLGPVLAASDAVVLLPHIQFHAPAERVPPGFRQVVFVAFRGVGVLPATRLAAADRRQGGVTLSPLTLEAS